VSTSLRWQARLDDGERRGRQCEHERHPIVIPMVLSDDRFRPNPAIARPIRRSWQRTLALTATGQWRGAVRLGAACYVVTAGRPDRDGAAARRPAWRGGYGVWLSVGPKCSVTVRRDDEMARLFIPIAGRPHQSVNRKATWPHGNSPQRQCLQNRCVHASTLPYPEDWH